MKVLAGDIGGTKTNLGLFEIQNRQLRSLFEATWSSTEFHSLEAIISKFLQQLPAESGGSELSIKHACFGIAGPVSNNRCDVTNLPWVIDGHQIQQQFAWQSVNLLNDLEANAWGIAALDDNDFVVLNQGKDSPGNASIIAAGTGLGQAGLFWDGRQHRPFASEGGHTDFCPATEQEYRLHQFLSKKYSGHVSWERIVSGMGLENLHQFLCHEQNIRPAQWLAEEMQQGDAAAAISKAAMAGKDPVCEQALDWFVHLYGVEAGNHALKIMSRGGVYLGGGIAPKIIKKLQTGDFINAFMAKGRMSHLLADMPVRVIMNDKTALYGPALYAGRQN